MHFCLSSLWDEPLEDLASFTPQVFKNSSTTGFPFFAMLTKTASLVFHFFVILTQFGFARLWCFQYIWSVVNLCVANLIVVLTGSQSWATFPTATRKASDFCLAQYSIVQYRLYLTPRRDPIRPSVTATRKTSANFHQYKDCMCPQFLPEKYHFSVCTYTFW